MDRLQIKEKTEKVALECPKCGAEMVVQTTGGWHFDGEPWDDIREFVVCPECLFETEVTIG